MSIATYVHGELDLIFKKVVSTSAANTLLIQSRIDMEAAFVDRNLQGD
jgi:hypothetical protein